MTNSDSNTKLERLLQSYVEGGTYSFEGFTRIEVNSVGKELETPLHMLVTQKDVEGVKLLIEAGANVNARTDIGSTPLQSAVIGGNLEIIRMLLAAGADPELASNFGQTAASLAEHRPNRDEVLALLRKH